MKKLLLALSLLPGVCFGQSKKKQIEILETRVDSLKTTLSETKVNLYEANKIIDSHKEKINDLESKYGKMEALKETQSQNNTVLQEKNDELQKKIETIEKSLSVANDTITVLRTKIESLNKSALPSVYLTYTIIQSNTDPDDAIYSSDEIKIYLYSNDLIIDTYTDYGAGDYSTEYMTLYLRSDVSQKYYSISIINEHQIVVSYSLNIEGEEQEVWNRTYSMLRDNNWSESLCEGDCQ